MFRFISYIVHSVVKTFKWFLVIFLCGTCSLYAQDSAGDQLFDESFVHEIRIAFSEPDFWEILTENYNNGLPEIDPNTGETLPGEEKLYLQATVSIDGNDVGIVGVRQKGFFSNWGAGASLKKPLKIDFNEFVTGNKYDGLKKLNLQNGFQDPSMMRDVIAYKLFRDNGIPAARTSYTKVYLNDVYWGLYVMVEQIDKVFLAENFSNDNGNLFKCIGDTDLKWEGTDYNSYTDDFDLKTNESENNWSDFINFVDVIDNSQVTNFESDLENTLLLDDYLKTLALDVMMNNWDSYFGQGRNFYLYYNTDENKFQWIPWDYNLSFMDFETELLLTNVADFFGEGYTEKPLTKNILANENLKQEYLQTICNLKNEYFTLAYLEDFIDQTVNLIAADLNEDSNKFYSMDEFENGTAERPELKSFINNRIVEIDNAFAEMNVDCFDLEDPELFVNEVLQLYPNPVRAKLHIVLNVDHTEMGQIELYNALGSLIYSNDNVQQHMQIETGHFKPGLYYMQYRRADKLWSKKLIVQ